MRFGTVISDKQLDRYIPLTLYIIVLGYILWFSFARNIIYSDMGQEHDIFQRILTSGHWSFVNDSLVNSALFSTWLPAMLQRLIRFPNPDTIFLVTPAIFFAVVPSMAYLIARRYLKPFDSLMIALFTATNFYVYFCPAHGRVEIGWALSAVLLYALLSNRRILAISMALLLPFSHYGTVFMLIPVLAVSSIFVKENRSLWVSCLVATASVGFVWYFLLAKTPGIYLMSFLFGLLLHVRPGADVVALTRAPGDGNYAAYACAWVSLALVAGGYIWAWVKHKFDYSLLVPSGVFIVYVILGFVLPYVSLFYGVGRAFFTGLPLLGIFLTVISGKFSFSVLWALVLLRVMFAGWYAF